MDNAPHSRRDRQSRVDFIHANTRLFAPGLVPEIKLHLADESLPMWEKTEAELGELNLPPPFWAFAWVGGQALARYVLDNPLLVAGKRVLDLGSGSGIVAIAAMQAGASTACAADIDAYSSVAASLNAHANVVIIDIAETDLLDSTPVDIDVLLVGDLFYERGMSERVFAFIGRMAAAGAVVLVGDPKRSYFPFDLFDTVARYDVATSRDIEDSDVKPADVWRLKPAAA
ncbi:MAG: 50S ribosomal protein L11 methyltransferase [Alphaproteobacteria bacterium]|nr:50S ribosomal protein L11 methyltransferase [Alphaproteobacteria bacterium]